MTVPTHDGVIELAGRVVKVDRGFGFSGQFDKMTREQYDALYPILGELRRSLQSGNNAERFWTTRVCTMAICAQAGPSHARQDVEAPRVWPRNHPPPL